MIYARFEVQTLTTKKKTNIHVMESNGETSSS